jgi:CubicO group peptidase (beta-lactamase class C family)
MSVVAPRARRSDRAAGALLIDGFAEAPFAPLADAFRAGFIEGAETGAALAVHWRGRLVVDLWGGVRDARSGAPWEERTIVPVFSTGKGLAAVACLQAVSRGWCRLDQPISRYWPAFAAHGKAGITLRQLLDHKAGLPLFGKRLGRRELAKPDVVSAVLEDMRLHWEPGRRWGYHVVTFGALLAEFLRHTDGPGRTFDVLFEDEIARSNGLSFFFGLPDAVPDERVARVSGPELHSLWDALVTAPFGLQRQVLNPMSMLRRAAREVNGLDMNDRRWLRLPLPSTNGVGDARSIARIYSMLATGGGELGLSADIAREIVSAPDVPPGGDRDAVMGVGGAWRLGFIQPSRDFLFSPSPDAFGMPGLGGSFGFCDPQLGLGYAYTPNRLGVLPFDDRRDRRLRRALYGVLRNR